MRYFRKLNPFIVALVVITGVVGSTLLVSQPAYADPQLHKTQEECEKAEYQWDDALQSCTDPEASSCAIAQAGWIVCPIMSVMADVADGAFTFLATFFLETNVDYIGSDQVKDAWNIMRSFANVVFVIVFMVIIYSQLTSTGINNYGVKKMLPRLIIAAILVNLSLVICQIAVDISNILGHNLKAIFETLTQQTVSYSPDNPVVTDFVAGGVKIAVVIAAVLAGGLGLAFAYSAPVLLAVILSLLMTILILVVRIALVIILIIISPLAFVAFLLPNTEQWFKKWYKMFFALLMVFPIISLTFGASTLVANLINSAAVSSGDVGIHVWIMQLTAIGVAAVPLFLVPSLLKNSINAAGALGTKLAGLSSKANSRVGSKIKTDSRLGEAQRSIKNKMALNRAMRRGKPGGIQSRLDNSRLGKKLGFDKGSAAAMSAVDEQDEKDVKQELTRFKNTNGATDIPGASDAMKQAIASGDSVKARAMQRYLAGSGTKGVKALEEVYSASSDTIRAGGPEGIQRSLASDALALGMKSKSAAIDSFSTSKDKSFDAIQQDSGTYSRLGASELAGQKNLAQLMTPQGAPVLDEKGNPVQDADGNDVLGLGTVSPAMAQSVMSSTGARDLLSVHDRQTMAALAGTDVGGNPLPGSAPAAPVSSGGGSTPSGGSSGGGGSIPAGWSQHSSGLVIPHGTSSSSSSSPAPSSAPAPAPAASASPTPAAAPASSAPAQPTNQQIEAAQQAAESQPKIVDKRGGNRPSFFGSKSSPTPPPSGSTTDASGRQTPASASEDYHDRMSR